MQPLKEGEQFMNDSEHYITLPIGSGCRGCYMSRAVSREL
jgi:hypothetical protein